MRPQLRALGIVARWEVNQVNGICEAVVFDQYGIVIFECDAPATERYEVPLPEGESGEVEYCQEHADWARNGGSAT